jgi:UDP-N-acetylmuramate dehydrogenase
LGIGGPAHFFAEPVDLDQMEQVMRWAAENELPTRVLGSGSNLLVRESGFDGLVLSLSAAATSGLSIEGERLTAGAGGKLSHAVVKAVGGGLGGLEHLVGIPGTVGAAVVGNVSSGGRDIGSVVERVRVMQPDGSIKQYEQDEIGFTHRETALAGMLVVEVDFKLEPGDPAALTKRLQKLWIARNADWPAEGGRIAMPFVDPDPLPARDLIQKVGLAGLREGNVSLDSAQPHYLIAHPGATSDECLTLIGRVREQVLLQTGIDLQLNLQIW